MNLEEQVINILKMILETERDVSCTAILGRGAKNHARREH